MDWYSYLAQQSVSEGAVEATTTPAQGPAPAAPNKGLFGGDMSFLLVVGGTFLVLYFLTIRPQRQEEKRKKEMLAQLSKGTPVVTTSGILGTVASVKEDSVVLNVGNGAKLEFLRSAIANVREKDTKPASTAKAPEKNKNKK